MCQNQLNISKSRQLQMRLNRRPVAGFTLIEMVIVIVMISILSAVGFLGFSYFKKQAMRSSMVSKYIFGASVVSSACNSSTGFSTTDATLIPALTATNYTVNSVTPTVVPTIANLASVCNSADFFVVTWTDTTGTGGTGTFTCTLPNRSTAAVPSQCVES